MTESPRYVTATNAAKILGVDRKTVTNRMGRALDAGEASEPVKVRNAAAFLVADVRKQFVDKDPGTWPDDLTVDLAKQPAKSPTIWLAVPSGEGDRAKELGAKWSRGDRRWFAPRAQREALAEWIDPGPLPQDLPDEDRTFGGGLGFEPIPRSAHANVRTRVSAIDWWRISYMVRSRANFTCELCDDAQRTMHCHERFEFDESTRTQTLRRLVCACELCHAGTHIGNTNARTATTNDVEHHMMRVLEIDAAELADRRRKADNLNFHLGTDGWKLDLSMLDALRIEIDHADHAAEHVHNGTTIAPAPSTQEQLAEDEDSFDPGDDAESQPWIEPAEVVDLEDDADAGDPWSTTALTPPESIATAETRTPRRSGGPIELEPPITAALLRRELRHIERGWVRRLLRRRR